VNFGRRALVAGGALVVAGGAFLLFRPSDESKIRAQLARLAAAVKVKEADMQTNPIGRLAHVEGEFESLFDPDVRASVPELGSIPPGRRGLAELVTGAPRYVRTFDVDFGNVTIKLDDAHTSALVGATARAKAVDRDGKVRDDERAVDFRFVKDGGDWIMTTVTVWPKGEAAPE
jgi:hypothetical protein